MDDNRVGQLAEGLAAVAIVGLVGNPVAAVALNAAVPFLRARLERHVHTRNQLSHVRNTIMAWAEGERLEEVGAGLEIATGTMGKYGLTAKDFQDLDYNAERGTTEIIRRARQRDPESWADNDAAYEDSGHVVARRAIRTTLASIASSQHGIEATLLTALREEFRDAHAQLAKLGAVAKDVQRTVDDVQGWVQQSSAPGSVADVMGYLRARIADWDVQVWTSSAQGPNAGRAPSAVERKLRLNCGDRGPSHIPAVLSTEEALEEQGMLVVLGGPGSGKSWLARRYARQAAHKALDLLEGGAGLDDVELPLLTTWDQWTRTPGSPRQSLLDAPFASGSGHSDVGTTDDVRRLQRVFTRPGAKVLLVVDSLDEAADLSQQADRLYELRSLEGWRSVVTSRPAAWHATYSPAGRDDEPLVVEIQDLSYPDDVEAFVQAWFAGDPQRGSALVQEIRDRADLSRAAVVPLILTFYCLLTEKSSQSHRRLPARRRELYQSLVRRLLLGKWSATAPGTDAGPDLRNCEGILSEWAWEAVRTQVTAGGLGDWADTFAEPTRVSHHDRRAIDHVAPKVGADDEGGVTRRFVHRTILEHFVAEYLATLGADEAANILLPHLWFDPDWEVAAPAGIAAHNRSHRGELFEQILHHACHPEVEDEAKQVAAGEFDKLLLAIAQESEPDEWTPQHRRIFDACRIRNAHCWPHEVSSTAHWTDSNEGCFAGVLAAVPTAEHEVIWDLVALLSTLNPSEAERAKARTALLAVLPSTEAGHVSGVVEALCAVHPTAAERAEARSIVLSALSSADGLAVGELAAALPALAATEEERAEVCAGVLEALPTADPPGFEELMVAFLALRPSDQHRAEVRSGVLEALLSTDTDVVDGRMAALSVLATSEAEMAEARVGAWAALRSASPRTVSCLVRGLSAFDPSDAVRAEARIVVLTALLAASAWEVAELVEALSRLNPSDAERAEARIVVMRALPSANRFLVANLARALSSLDPLDAERAEARSGVLTALASAPPMDIHHLAEALPSLVSTDAERAEARSGVMAALPCAHPVTFQEVVEVLSALDPSDEERADAFAHVLKELFSEDLPQVRGMIMALYAVVATDEERAEARTGVLSAMRSVEPRAVRDLVAALFALHPSDAERAEAKAGVVAAMSFADPIYLRGLLEALSALNPSDAERDVARVTVVAALPWANSWDLNRLVPALRYFSSSQFWLTWLASAAT